MMRNEYIYEYIGKTIKNRRKTLKLTQKDLARKLFISRASLANIETGRQNVLVHQLYNFAKTLELDVKDFLVRPESTNALDKANNLSFSLSLNAQQKNQLAQLIEN